MGLPSIQSQGFVELDKRFSDDILKIELSHPEHRHLSVVDVPGLFHSMSLNVETDVPLLKGIEQIPPSTKRPKTRPSSVI